MKKIGRNEPCPCGCGRKFKVCLAERRERATAAHRNTAAARMRQAKIGLNRAPLPVAAANAEAAGDTGD